MNQQLELELVLGEETAATQAPVPRGRKRNLGGAIVLIAIGDYRGKHELRHQDAKRFLYPCDAEQREHFARMVAMAEGVNPAWLRSKLDRLQGQWDGERQGRRRCGL